MSRALLVVLECSFVWQCSAGWRHRQFPLAERCQEPTEVRVLNIDSTAGFAAPVDACVVVEPIGPSPLDLSYEHALRESEAFVAAQTRGVGSWIADDAAGVPLRMLRAEFGMQQAAEASPEGTARSKKMVGLASRLYAHARWLAENQHMIAAERRYRASADWGQRAGNLALATHSLSRLGYYLIVWGRNEEAKQVLREAVVLAETVPQSEASRAATYLYGTLQRRDAISIGDANTLYSADARIVSVGKLPSSELEADRHKLVGSINYWREAEASPMRCFDTQNAAHIAICFWSHFAQTVHRSLA